MENVLEYSPDELFRDPYPFYAALRRDKPVHYYEPTGEWLITRWADCQIAGASSDVFVPSDGFMPMVKTMEVPNVLTMTGSEHSCLRQGIDAPLIQPAVDVYVDNLARPIVQACLAELRERGEADLTKEFFEPISVRCVANVMGLTEVDSATLVRWFHALNTGAQNVGDDPAVWQMLDDVKAEIETAVGAVYEKVVSTPDGTLISHTVHGGMPEGSVRSLAEIMPTLHVIILGGLQEPGHGAANAALGLLQNPEQAAALAANPGALSLKAYDEGLRWIAPIGVAARRASRSFTIAGTTIPEGAIVGIVLASANRDEERWEEANEFRIDRARKPNAAFGYRPHFCSGHYLSRNIGRIALEECFSTLPGLRLDPTGRCEAQGWRFRGVINLPAKWNA